MNNLEKLYYNMSKLSDNYADTAETIAARCAVERAMGKKRYFEYEDKISLLAASTEKQGFITGFRYAVSLLVSGKETTI